MSGPWTLDPLARIQGNGYRARRFRVPRLRLASEPSDVRWASQSCQSEWDRWVCTLAADHLGKHLAGVDSTERGRIVAEVGGRGPVSDVKIAPALSGLRIPIDSVSPFPGNPRQGDVGAICESLRRFGQQKPIVVQASTRYIVAGNHLWKGAKALGWGEVAANVVDMDDRTASAYLIADNRTSELGAYDDDALGEMLRVLAEQDNLRATGYDADDVDAFLRDLAKDQGVKVPGEFTFATELMEAHNYVVLVFDNELDWNVAQQRLGLQKVSAPDATETYNREGIGRVLRGIEVIGRIPE